MTRRWVLRLGFAFLVLGSFLAWRAGVHYLGGVRVVLPGEVLRSPQLSVSGLQTAIDEYGVRSVLNLRGKGDGRRWYGEERAVCERAGVAHATVTFKVDEWPPRPVALRFLKTLESLAPPVLMHCFRGIDRTGWAGGVVVLADGGALEEAEAQLSPVLGHICIRSKCPQHLFFAAYRRGLAETGQIHSKAVFRRWIAESYCPDSWNARLAFGGEVPSEAVGGSALTLSVEATNRGRNPWRTGSSGDIRLGIRIIGPLASIPENQIGLFLDRQTTVVDLGRGGVVDAQVDPGESRVFEATVRLPSNPGLYLLQADMVMEHVHWFSEMGWPGLVWLLDIVEQNDE